MLLYQQEATSWDKKKSSKKQTILKTKLFNDRSTDALDTGPLCQDQNYVPMKCVKSEVFLASDVRDRVDVIPIRKFRSG